MVYSATNPNLAASSLGTRRMEAVDALLILRDITDGAETATASETGLNIRVEKLGNTAIVINSSGTAGTVDGSNYFTVSIEVADNVGFTNATTVFSKILPAAADELYVMIDGYMMETLRTAGEDESIYIRSTATKTGTTATSVTYGAYLTPACG